MASSNVLTKRIMPVLSPYNDAEWMLRMLTGIENVNVLAIAVCPATDDAISAPNDVTAAPSITVIDAHAVILQLVLHPPDSDSKGSSQSCLETEQSASLSHLLDESE